MNMPSQVEEELSSPPSDISSPPSSPPQNLPESITVAPRRSGEGVVNSAAATSAQPALLHNAAVHSGNGTISSTNTNTAAPAKVKRPRKPKDSKDAKSTEPVKEKKPRKPREPKVKKEGDAVAAAPRKRQKAEEKATSMLIDVAMAPRQPTILEMVNHPPQSLVATQGMRQPSSIPPPPLPRQQSTTDSLLRSSIPPHVSSTPTPRPYSSGQNYDPIRGSTIDAAPPRPPAVATVSANGLVSVQASPRISGPSASPSITSLIDPQPATNGAAPATTPQPPHISLQHQSSQPAPSISLQHSPTPTKTAPVSQTSIDTQLQPGSPLHHAVIANMDGAMDIDMPTSTAVPLAFPKVEGKAPSKSSSSAAPTPKAAAVKVANSPPKVTGSGLLSSSDLFGGPSSNAVGERKGVDIEIRIALNPQGGNIINIAQEIAKKYGRDAINPRVAAHRQRLLQVAAAANRLEGGSADDMSVDLVSEEEGDSNVEMGGVDEDKSATGVEEKPRKRRKKVEEYDKEDDFIDDTELAWQEAAAVAKDGFFVYSGPLIAEGQTAQVESSSGTRGRGGGRGRGRGRAAAAAAAGGTSHASSADKNDPSTSGRGRGRGRGTGAPRKPRITKADRERMEAEKAEKEQATAAKVAGSTLVPLTSTPTPIPIPTSTPATFAESTAQPQATMLPAQPAAAGNQGAVPV